jgi:hypothetical protein
LAKRLPDGSIRMADGRIVYADSLIQAQDLLEIIPLVTPPPAWPFVSGGGGGGGSGTPGARGADGADGAAGAQGPQGTNPGPPGTWTKVSSGVTAIGPGATVTLASAPLPLGPAVYVPFVTFDVPGGAPLALCQGNTLGVVPIDAIYFSLEFSGGAVALVAKSAASAPPCNLNWVLYKVIP